MAWVVLGDRMRCKFPFGIMKNQILPVGHSGGAMCLGVPHGRTD